MGSVDPYQPQSKYHGQDRQTWLQMQPSTERRYPYTKTSSSPVPTFDFIPIPAWQPSASRTGGGSGGGVLEGLGKFLGDLAHWVVEHTPPLRWCAEFGISITELKWKVRLPLAVIGGLAGIGLVVPGLYQPSASPAGIHLFVSIAGTAAPLLALVIGAITGWGLPNIAGMLVIFAVYGVALAIGLSLIALIVSLVYGIVAAFAGWAPFTRSG